MGNRWPWKKTKNYCFFFLNAGTILSENNYRPDSWQKNDIKETSTIPTLLVFQTFFPDYSINVLSAGIFTVKKTINAMTSVLYVVSRAQTLFCRSFLFKTIRETFGPECSETVTIATHGSANNEGAVRRSTFVCEQQRDEKMGMNSFDFTDLMGPTAERGWSFVVLQVHYGASPPQKQALSPLVESICTDSVCFCWSDNF